MKIDFGSKNRYLLAAGVIFSFVLVYSAISVFVFSDDNIDRFYVNVMDEEVLNDEAEDDAELEDTGKESEEIEGAKIEVSEDEDEGEYAASRLFGRKERGVDEGGSPFKDVPDDHKSASAITALYHEGILEGYGDGTFDPDGKINRAEFTKLLVEAANVDFSEIDSSEMKNCFSDVGSVSDQWFVPFVCAAKYKGWVSGYSDGTFAPVRDINKAEGLKVILEVLGFEIPDRNDAVVMPYSDVSHDDWYFGVAKAGKENKLISAGENFNAAWRLTRADVAGMMYRAMRAKGLL